MKKPVLKILVAESDPAKAARLRECLQQSEPGCFDLTCVAELNDALHWLRSNRVDALVLALAAPSDREKILRAQSFAPDLPIIVLTPGGEDSAGLSALCHGVEGCVSARCADGRCLAEVLRGAMERKRQETALRAAHADLEKRLEGRSAELLESYRAWRAETTRRRQTEKARKEVLRRLNNFDEAERRRFSRELHDCLGQDLTALKMELRLLQDQSPAASDIGKRVAKLEELADGLMRDAHRLAWEMHPPVLDDLGLEAALRRYTAQWSESSNVPLDFHSNCAGYRLSTELETTLYRITQEALTNVARHASAKHVSVLLERRSGRISLIVEDDGRGFDPDETLAASITRGKLGLVGMQERVDLENGTLQIESVPGAGTTIFARISVKDAPTEGVKP